MHRRTLPDAPAARLSKGGTWRLCMGRVLRKRCPQCGVGKLFRTTFRLAERCDHCGLVYRRAPGAQTGSMYVCAAVTELFAAFLVVLVLLFTNWSPALAMSIGIPIVLAFSYAFLPYSMAAWVGTDYLTDVGNREWWAQLRVPGDPVSRQEPRES
ncbi:MAG: DUF983 domain-containing protein [Planctomycetota bacterium]|nr:MAG: DUF983 domain-containing protein [Planctomycetota bacterium]